MALILRLDPAHPPLWRDPRTLQFGSEPRLVLAEVSPWQERLVHELGRGIGETALTVWAELWRVRPSDARAFVRRLGPLVRRTLAEEDARTVRRVRVEAPRGVLGDAVVVALASDGCLVARVEPGETASAPPDEAALAVLVADRVLDPRRARPHLREDRPHLPVLATGDAVEVGPLVVPGRTACTVCLDLHRTDRDPAWPVLAAQLLGAAPAPADAALAHEAAATIVRLLREREDGAAVRVTASGRTRVLIHPHGACGCLALPGNATVRDLPAPRRAPSSGSAWSVPA